jgi:hypothetical protein
LAGLRKTDNAVYETIMPVGSEIEFGSYEQDNNNSNGKENIEWVVLAAEGSIC